MFLYAFKQIFHISRMGISQKANGAIMRNLQHVFFMRTRIFIDFHISIDVTLKLRWICSKLTTEKKNRLLKSFLWLYLVTLNAYFPVRVTNMMNCSDVVPTLFFFLTSNKFSPWRKSLLTTQLHEKKLTVFLQANWSQPRYELLERRNYGKILIKASKVSTYLVQ